MKKALIVGLNIGEVYKEQLLNRNFTVVTADLDKTKNPTYTDYKDALHQQYDMAFICTPNFLHQQMAYDIAPHTNILFVEKPGLKTEEDWYNLITTFPDVLITTAFNNAFRPQCDFLREIYKKHAKKVLPTDVGIVDVTISWLNCRRVPGPGTWFTNKKLAWGGVSRDLMPHILSIADVIHGNNWNRTDFHYSKDQHWNLDQIIKYQSDYGIIDLKGTYDVDDNASIRFLDEKNNVTWHLEVDWMTLGANTREVSITFADDTVLNFDLGLCPNYVYGLMVDKFLEYYRNLDQYQQSINCYNLRLHRIMEKFDEI